MNPTKHYNTFVELNAENLGEDELLYVGKIYKLPDTTLSTNKKVEEVNLPEYPIFGDDFSKIDSLSNRLEGTVYYLISGHGGPDPGAIVKYGDKLIAEDEYAYDVTLRLARELLGHGAEVHIIVEDENDGIRDNRALELDTDETVANTAIPLSQLQRLKQRTEAVNTLYLGNRGKYQRLLVTHVDSRSKGTNIDVFFYHHEKSKNGKRLAESIHRTFLRKYKKFQPNRVYNGTFMERSSLYVVKNTLPAMAYIEIGNIRSKKDQRRILDPDNRQALAKWISEGIILDYESSKVKTLE
ncbi:N-acetylmuramoyl-L-alanine amidase [Allomuricauda sp. d1]|uniref:N-acetylmuramoyl-L-alanine amidase family protein n=1 Tax=Allomuricauda sp. d1 TaxID=3136725 RepID=UPI0031DA4CA6